ncbi:MAG: cation diffusion facilitator family transporter [Oscillospiraceae bacterium]
MSELLIKLFQKKYKNGANREKFGAFAGAVGLFCNILLFAVKLAVGLLSASLSIIADAVNNLSDAGASLVTLLGFKLAQKPADKEHPFGHARIEYLSGVIIALAIMLLGVELLKSSFRKIISPAPVEFSIITFCVLGFAVAVKLWMMLFYHKIAKIIESSTLTAAAGDSRNDIVTTMSVLLASLAQYFWGFQIDGWVGAGVAVFILISGIGILKDALSPLLGEAPSTELMEKLENKILSYDGVLDIHDLMVHSYGPARRFATVHVEMNASDDPLHSHGVLDNIERDVEQHLGVKLVIHLDPVIIDDEELNGIKSKLNAGVRGIDPSLSIHDLRIARTHDHTNLFFDVAVPSGYNGGNDDLTQLIKQAVKAIDPTYFAVLEIDRNYQASLD